ncbi:unnamed protein product [Gongylonema pulchrum]|uniref:Uncharacterized protein n=1 Tax=Gongylonema pulchrum TaxID=637853 RepID=A0A183DL30_9BILA|nr:unnamed protein product [Gongylonema pulchrum]
MWGGRYSSDCISALLTAFGDEKRDPEGQRPSRRAGVRRLFAIIGKPHLTSDINLPARRLLFFRSHHCDNSTIHFIKHKLLQPQLLLQCLKK